MKGIEPLLTILETVVLPLNHMYKADVDHLANGDRLH